MAARSTLRLHRYRPIMTRNGLLAVITAATLAVVVGHGVRAEPVRTPHVEAELVAERTAFVPGKPLTVALRLAMQRGWHTYWRNPGDSGLATTLAWTLPQGMSAGPIQWATPQPLPVGPLVNYGYDGEVLLLVDITAVPDFLSGKSATLNARADWLVCKEICIPEGADLTLTLPIATQSEIDPRWGTAITDARAALPRPLDGWRVVATGKGDTVELALSTDAVASNPGTLRFFPNAEGKIEAGGAQTLVRDGTTTRLLLPVANQRVGDFARVAGVLTASDGFGGARAVTIDVPLAGAVTVGSKPVTGGAAAAPTILANVEPPLPFVVALVFAFIGGVLLNLMPCVFPVLSLKALGFATHGEGRTLARRHGLAFAAGVVVSFWILAGALVALRAAGTQLGWGFQLQSPVVVSGLAILFFVLALNLSGLFDIGRLLPSAVTSWNAKNPYVNDALSGVLAVVVASPCSAPFMGAALGYALTESVAVTWITFTMLGLGMALPYVLLMLFPGWRGRLPRPGPWMVRLRQLLAFPLYATVLWLAWVLGAQLDNNAVARLGATLLLIAFALWAWQLRRAGGTRAWGAGALAALAGAAVAAWPIVGATGSMPGERAGGSVAEAGPWQSYTPDRLAQLTGDGRAVFVDFTAAWCVTCQVNKQLVLNTDAVQDAFAKSKVTLVRADWTRRDPAIGKALAALGRNGVPVYVLYRPGQGPLLLPEVLQQRNILEALATL